MAKYAITADKSRWKYEKFVVVVRLPRTTLNVATSNLVPRVSLSPLLGAGRERPWERGWAISRGTGSRGVENAGSGGKRVVRWKTRDLVENALIFFTKMRRQNFVSLYYDEYHFSTSASNALLDEKSKLNIS